MGAIPERFRINTVVTPYNPSDKEGPVMNLLLADYWCLVTVYRSPPLAACASRITHHAPACHPKGRHAKTAQIGYKRGVTMHISLIEDDARLRGIVAGWLRGTKDMRLLSDFCDAETALSALPAQSPTWCSWTSTCLEWTASSASGG